jgi:cytidylate kinase
MTKLREKVEANVSSWLKHWEEPKVAHRLRKNRPFVTISREVGAYGMTIADMLAENLRKRERRREALWTVFDKELIKKVIEEHDFPKKFEKYFSESSSPLIEDILSEILGLHPPQETLVHKTSETILHLARAGYVILVGRGANIITRKLVNGVHVRLVGSFEKRVAHMQGYLNLDKKHATDYVIKEERERRDYIKRFFQKDLSDASLYDIVVNTDTMPLDDVVMIVSEMVLKGKRTRGA